MRQPQDGTRVNTRCPSRQACGEPTIEGRRVGACARSSPAPFPKGFGTIAEDARRCRVLQTHPDVVLILARTRSMTVRIE